jgi:acetylornithine deacetylase/succinyl-diaminopimelate desuccinylase-like protein
MVAEKQMCWIKATLRGRGGHGSMPLRGQAMARLADLLQRLDRHRLPVHVTPVARQMIEDMASLLPLAQRMVLRQLLNHRLTGTVLNQLGSMGEALGPLLHNTVSPTILHASKKINVIPSNVSVELDGRLLPGYGPDDMMAELRQLLGDEVELELIAHEPGPPEADMGLFDTLAGILREQDPEGKPCPMLLAGVTDGRHFARLGIQTYGFTPIVIPRDLSFWELFHGPDERIPVAGLEFGCDAVFKLLQRFGQDNGA